MYDASTRSATVVLQQKMSYESFFDLVYSHLQLQRGCFHLKFKLFYTYGGFPQISEIYSDSSLEVLYQLAEYVENFIGHIHIILEPVISVQQSSCMDLLRSFSVSTAPEEIMTTFLGGNVTSQDHQAGSSSNFDAEYISNIDIGADDHGGFDNSDDDISQTSEDTESLPSCDESTDNEEGYENAEHHNNVVNQGVSYGEVTYSEDPQELRHYEAADFDDEDYTNIWNEETKEICVGMYFKSKDDLTHAARLWNLARNCEPWVVESKSFAYRAKCYTLNPHYNSDLPSGPRCGWFVYATKPKHHNMWRISRWVNAHNCYGSVVGNNNRGLKSRDIVTRIIHFIRQDVTFPVKQIQAHIKDTLNVDVSYNKAWRARKAAIEMVYGSWDSNFEELPRYINALQETNHVIVEWLHHPASSSQHHTFKFVFWAFGPLINTFKHCQPVISIYGTFLKGSYRAKMLIAVCKNANNYVLPVAYAIVDEETTESWSWNANNYVLPVDFVDNIINILVP
ncbi:hypothetical protein QVD17_39738 [Tagetes erecta]|uniref:MULE transposase domain-containing protein n=1 Tax=Tagetes erecta TaxID=13708 RepID=A0AAD8NAE4_TARER|nr:hypothetical protein QVD17_39738 [Tagetes erecta]